LWETARITETVYTEAVVLGQAQGAPDALTIRLFWQQHQLSIVPVVAEVLAAYRQVQLSQSIVMWLTHLLTR